MIINDYIDMKESDFSWAQAILCFWITRIIVAKGARNQRLTLLDTPITYSFIQENVCIIYLGETSRRALNFKLSIKERN